MKKIRLEKLIQLHYHYDRATNKPIAKISLDNAYKNVSDDVKKRNAKIKKGKKNYYKEESPFDL